MNQKPRFQFTAVSGFFQHDKEPEGPQFRATTTPNLGLLHPEVAPKTPDEVQVQGWELFLSHLQKLNQAGPAKYKLFYVIRHGEGDHNVKEAQVGRFEWERHWARLDGDKSSTWFDAYLTEKGQQQARAISMFLSSWARQTGMPLPKRHYTSPLARCLETTRLAFLDVQAVEENTEVIVKESLRERVGVHTCDRRRPCSWIRENYPSYEIEEGFAEQDKLWKRDIRESLEEHIQRIEDVLQDIFASDPDVVISLTAHSGTIRAFYAAVAHREVWVSAGAMVPVLIKAELGR